MGLNATGGTDGNDILNGDDGNDFIHGGAGNDTLDGGTGSNSLYGDAGSDTLRVANTSNGNLLSGGTGTDTLNGGYYADTYLFNLGDGVDTITETVNSSISTVYTDVLRFGTGIAATDIKVQRVGTDLVFAHSNGVDKVMLKDVFTTTTSGADIVAARTIEKIEFADGTVWTWAQLTQGGLTQVGSAAADTIYGWNGNDLISGGDGNDTLDGGTGSNSLYGDAGSDTLRVANTSNGNLLSGGTGNDTLNGGYYADTYLFNLGDGVDTITETVNSSISTVYTDVLRFGTGIAATDIKVQRVGTDLVFAHSNGVDKVMLKDVFTTTTSGADIVAARTIEKIEFADGTVWTWAQLTQGGLTQVGSAAADTIYGWNGNDLISGGDGNDTLDGGTGSNSLYGDAGSDTLRVANTSNGNLLSGGTGNDTLNGGYYADTYLFNLGDGVDTITETVNSSISTVYTDVLRFGTGIAATDIKVQRVGTDLVFAHSNGVDKVMLKDVFTTTTSGADIVAARTIEKIEFADGTVWTWAQMTQGGLTQVGSTAADTIYGWNGNDFIHGGAGNDTLDGGTGSNSLYGEAGNDTLRVANTSNGNLLSGGTGTDTLNGGYYADTYLFNLGDGVDTITETVNSSISTVYTDVLRFGTGIAATDIKVQRVGTDLVFAHSNGVDKVMLKDVFTTTTSGADIVAARTIEKIEFADGTVWTWAQMTQGGLTQVGSTAADTIYGWNGNDFIHGGAGNDTLDGGTGSNSLYGDAGSDTLRVANTSNGNLLSGGTGNDTLNGGYYADTYLFNLGDGVDTITETVNSSISTVYTDVLRFGTGIAATDIKVQRVGTDLVFAHSNGVDKVMLKDVFTTTTSGADIVAARTIEKIEFADGTVWTWAQLTQGGLTQVGSAAADTIYGWNGNDLISGGDGNDTLDGGTGSNSLYGDAGSDTLRVANTSNGNLLSGGTGNDTLNGGYYADTYLFNLGDGVDTITETVNSSISTVYTDVLRFGTGIAATDIKVQRVGTDLVFAHSNGVDKVMLKDVFTTTTSGADIVAARTIEKIEFADGTVWTWAQMTQGGLTQVGSTAADTIYGWNGNDFIHGGAGNDTLDGGTGSNSLYGEAGNDTLRVANTSNGNLLSGGTGTDTLNGGYYADTYLFNLGDGVDTITETVNSGTSTVYTDVLRFGDEVAPEQLWFRQAGSSLEVSIIGTADKVTINNWYSGNAYRVEQFKTADGESLMDSQVQNLVNAMAAFGVPAGSEGNLTAEQRQQLDVVLAANWQ
ncbi:hypothetical protein HNE05_14875 [Aquipseudomonas campi]|uniref:Haemolysin-type calcium binding-related domain-containing protein n=1 Tax=Aquipseudomonas campi TaxID=2731681 RepID=A0A6M8G6N5_9GAMM|nr:calcium-binding protein [Pseudomonas campi]QKE64575.1 hypothetical protein HNE05_14875 [Pseudomonas campi]